MYSREESTTRLSLLMRVRDLSDAAAWQDFVECYAPRVFSWCCRLGLQESDAADATQSVLLKLVEGLKSFDYDPKKGRFRGWLKTVTRHVATDVARTWRERGTGGSGEIAELDTLAQADPAESLLQEIEAAYQQELLRMASVTVRLRVKSNTWEAWRLTSEENFPAPDVARRLEMTLGDIYVAKSRVLKMLREEVQRLENAEIGVEA